MIRKHKERTKHGKRVKKVNFNISVQAPVSFFVYVISQYNTFDVVLNLATSAERRQSDRRVMIMCRFLGFSLVYESLVFLISDQIATLSCAVDLLSQ